MTERAASASGSSFGEVLVRLAGERPNLLLVVGEDPGPAAWFAEIWPDRVLIVPPLPTRIGIAEGIAHGGGDAMVIVDGEATDLPVDADTAVVLVSTDPAHLALAFRARIEVCQPGWAADLPALLVGALGTPTPTLLFLADPSVDPGAIPPPTSFGEQRILHRGPAGLVIGSGATAVVAREVAAALARRQVEVTALDLHTISPDSVVDASLLHTHLLVGPLSTPRAAALAEVPVDGGIADVADRVQSALHASART